MAPTIRFGDQHPIVGREPEQARLRQLLNAAMEGYGSLALVSGEAGIGKTTLIQDLIYHAREQSALVLTGGCFDLTSTSPYSPWNEVFESYMPLEGVPLSVPVLLQANESAVPSQAALFATVRDFFTSTTAARPVLLVLEDMHWSDQASLDLLRYLSRRIDGFGMLIIVTYRDDELTRRHPLSQLLPALVRECRAIRLNLKRLDTATLRHLVHLRYRLVSSEESQLVGYLERQSEGNPFYFNELLRSLEEEAILSSSGDGWHLGDLAEAAIPPLILQIIQARLGRLSEETAHLLTVAAIIGQEVDLETWRCVSQASNDDLANAIEEATDAHLLAEIRDGPRLQFTHALIREAFYTGIVLPRRHSWHRRTAEALSSQHQPDPDLVAFHFQQAADPKAAEWLIRAGEKAQLLYAPHAAIDRFTAALDLANVLDLAQQVTCHRGRGLAYETIGALAAAQADYETALELARIVDRNAEWRILLDLGMLWAARDYTRTGEYYQRALLLAREIDDSAMAAHSLNRLGNWHMNIDQPVAAQRYHREALATFRTAHDRPGIAETLDLLGATMSVSGDLQETAICFEEAIDLFRALDDRQGLASALATSAERGGWVGLGAVMPVATLAQSQMDAEAALHIARDISWRAGEVYALVQVGMVLGAQGKFDRALVALSEAEHIANEIEHRHWLAVVHCLLGDLYVKMLATSQAHTQLEQAIALCRQVHSVLLERISTIHLALTHILRGELDEAGKNLDSISDGEIDPSSMSLTLILAWHARAELALARGDPIGARRIVEHVHAHIPNAAPDHVPVWSAIIRGEALTAMGGWDAAEGFLRAAIRDARVQGAEVLRMRALLSLTALYRAQGRIAAAERQYVEVQTLVDELAETIPDEKLRANFRQRATTDMARVRTDTPGSFGTGVFELSSREIEVLQLVSEGLTDAAVAERLVISRRTVTSHLTSIYSKLGVSTRTAATRLAIDQGIV